MKSEKCGVKEASLSKKVANGRPRKERESERKIKKSRKRALNREIVSSWVLYGNMIEIDTLWTEGQTKLLGKIES